MTQTLGGRESGRRPSAEGSLATEVSRTCYMAFASIISCSGQACLTSSWTPLAGLQVSVSLPQPFPLNSSPNNGWPGSRPIQVQIVQTPQHILIGLVGPRCRQLLVHYLFTSRTGVRVYLIPPSFSCIFIRKNVYNISYNLRNRCVPVLRYIIHIFGECIPAHSISSRGWDVSFIMTEVPFSLLLFWCSVPTLGIEPGPKVIRPWYMPTLEFAWGCSPRVIQSGHISGLIP